MIYHMLYIIIYMRRDTENIHTNRVLGKRYCCSQNRNNGHHQFQICTFPVFQEELEDL